MVESGIDTSYVRAGLASDLRRLHLAGEEHTETMNLKKAALLTMKRLPTEEKYEIFDRYALTRYTAAADSYLNGETRTVTTHAEIPNPGRTVLDRLLGRNKTREVQETMEVKYGPPQEVYNFDKPHELFTMITTDDNSRPDYDPTTDILAYAGKRKEFDKLADAVESKSGLDGLKEKARDLQRRVQEKDRET